MKIWIPWVELIHLDFVSRDVITSNRFQLVHNRELVPDWFMIANWFHYNILHSCNISTYQINIFFLCKSNVKNRFQQINTLNVRTCLPRCAFLGASPDVPPPMCLASPISLPWCASPMRLPRCASPNVPSQNIEYMCRCAFLDVPPPMCLPWCAYPDVPPLMCPQMCLSSCIQMQEKSIVPLGYSTTNIGNKQLQATTDKQFHQGNNSITPSGTPPLYNIIHRCLGITSMVQDGRDSIESRWSNFTETSRHNGRSSLGCFQNRDPCPHAKLHIIIILNCSVLYKYPVLDEKWNATVTRSTLPHQQAMHQYITRHLLSFES